MKFIMPESQFLTNLSNFMIVRRYSPKTIKSYIYWIKAFINFNQKKHPDDLGGLEVEQFLTHLAVNRSVSISTQSLALNALVFLYNKFLEKPLGDLSQFRRVKRARKLPIVLTQEEVLLLFSNVDPKYKLMVGMLYGSGLRRIELLRLRVNDIDLAMKQVRVWNSKGYKSRITTLATELIPAIQKQLMRVQQYLDEDLDNPQYSGVWMPNALERKYRKANKILGWHYRFPSYKLSVEPTTGLIRRHHVDESLINKVIKRACQKAGITKQVSSHTLRHSFATN